MLYVYCAVYLYVYDSLLLLLLTTLDWTVCLFGWLLLCFVWGCLLSCPVPSRHIVGYTSQTLQHDLDLVVVDPEVSDGWGLSVCVCLIICLSVTFVNQQESWGLGWMGGSKLDTGLPYHYPYYIAIHTWLSCCSWYCLWQLSSPVLYYIIQ